MAEYIERTEELMLAMNAGARAIENTRRYHGAVYTKDVFSESPREIPYLLAAKVLREVSDAPPLMWPRWCMGGGWNPALCWNANPAERFIQGLEEMPGNCGITAPNCGAKMDGGGSDAAD